MQKLSTLNLKPNPQIRGCQPRVINLRVLQLVHIIRRRLLDAHGLLRHGPSGLPQT